MSPPSDASATVLTASGRGAIAVIALWGPDALTVADRAFRPVRGKPLRDTAPDRPRLGRIGAGLGDEVVAILRSGSAPEVEIHGHGGLAATELVLEALGEAGAKRVEPSRWVVSHSRSRIEVEARLDLPHASTLRTAELLLGQASGALEREILRIETIVNDDPEAAAGALNRLVRHGERWGVKLASAWTLVLNGRPNVGKSRLMNALAGYDRSIVAPTPGTTRDVVTVATAIAGWPIQLSDTAGLRVETVDSVEAQGVHRARQAAAAADEVLLVLDRSTPLTPCDQELLVALPEAIRVANKSDLLPAWSPAHVGGAVEVSALDGTGLDTLLARLAGRLDHGAPAQDDPVPFRPGHLESLRAALTAIHSGRSGAAGSILRIMREAPAERALDRAD